MKTIHLYSSKFMIIFFQRICKTLEYKKQKNELLVKCISNTFSPSAVQSEIGHPWSAVENGQAPFEIWRYQKLRSPEQSLKTFKTEQKHINLKWRINNKCANSKDWTKFFWRLIILLSITHASLSRREKNKKKPPASFWCIHGPCLWLNWIPRQVPWQLLLEQQKMYPTTDCHCNPDKEWRSQFKDLQSMWFYIYI